MILVAGDSATSLTAVALKRGEETLRRETDSGKSQSEKFLFLIDEILRDAGIRPEEVDAFGLVEGPGSFTGLRIGFSVMKGLAFALQKPLYLYNRLDLMARAASAQGLCLSVVDAQRNSWYTALFENGKKLSDYLDLEESRVLSLLKDPVSFIWGLNVRVPENQVIHLCGEWKPAWREMNASKEIQWIPAEVTRRVDSVLLNALSDDLRNGVSGVDPMSAVPFYLRRSEAENVLEEKKKLKVP